MKLLLSNDDGVFADGLKALALELSKKHTLTIAAPDREQSCVSRMMTLYAPLRAKRAEVLGFPADTPAFAVSGTPVDCVRLAVGNLCKEAPDMVVSGINHGANLGTDTLYSGTVAAAAEAALLGYPAIAVSCCRYHPAHLDTAARVAMWAVDYLWKNPLPYGMVLSVNVPDLPFEELRGVRFCRLCVSQYNLKYVERDDPSGQPYYWAPRGKLERLHEADMDEIAVRDGFAAVTPLTYDLTEDRLLAAMREKGENEAWKAY